MILEHKNSVVFRLATVFGFSYRMRTDLLVNFLVHKAVTKKILKIFQPNFRRNYVHVSDVVEAFIFAIQNFSLFNNCVINVRVKMIPFVHKFSLRFSKINFGWGFER